MAKRHYTERIEVVGGLFQPICHAEPQPVRAGECSDLRTACRVCGKTIYVEEEPRYCEEHGDPKE